LKQNNNLEVYIIKLKCLVLNYII